MEFSPHTLEGQRSISDEGITIHSFDSKSDDPCFEFGEVTIDSVMTSDSDSFMVYWSAFFDARNTESELIDTSLSFFDSSGNETGRVGYNAAVPTRFSLGVLDSADSESFNYSVSFKPNSYSDVGVRASSAASSQSGPSVASTPSAISPTHYIRGRDFLVNFLGMQENSTDDVFGVTKIFPGAITVQPISAALDNPRAQGATAGPITYEPWKFVVIVESNAELADFVESHVQGGPLGNDSFAVTFIDTSESSAAVMNITCDELVLISFSPFATLENEYPRVLEMELTIKPGRCVFTSDLLE